MKRYMMTFALLCAAVCTGVSCSDDDNPPEKVYRVGDLYDAGSVKGVVFHVEDGGRDGLIVSLGETTAQWATEAAAPVKTGAMDTDDGEDNMEAIQRIADWQTKFPAFAWCGAMNTVSVKGWFLPAYEQLSYLYRVYAANKEAFNKVLTDNGGTALVVNLEENGNYWSSSESVLVGGEGEAAYFDFVNQSIGVTDKIDINRVRAVREF